jgi:serine/threonine-protein kinase
MADLVTLWRRKYYDLEMRDARSEPSSPKDMLDSWKAIAGYLERGVRTVMRWELVRGLPVHRVPGGGKPGVYALKSELDRWWARTRLHVVEDEHPTVPSHRPSVAVLPFASLSSNKENEYFSDGLADEIITALTGIRDLRVTARTSSFAFRSKEQDVRKIGAILGVSTLLEGSVQRSGRRIRVSAQLVDARNGFHLWSQHYDRALGDLFDIQDDISNAIARALELRLTPERSARRTPELEAYNLWLKGRYYQQYETVDAIGKSRACLEQAIARDPRFPQPYVALAELFRAAAHFGTVRPREALLQGQAAIRTALELDPSLGEAHAMSGAYKAWMQFDWEGARADFDRALQLAPGSEQVHRMRATHYLVPTNQLTGAEEEMRRALESDPLSPLTHVELGKVLLWRRQFDRAQAAFETAFELRPEYPLALWYRGAALYFQGQIEEAVAFWQSSLQKIGTSPAMICAIGMSLGQLGRQDAARGVLTKLQALASDRYVTPVGLAQIYLGLGEHDAAFERLERAIEDRDSHILILPCKPIWDGIRGDPRFRALLRTMRLIQPTDQPATSTRHE